MNMTKGMMVAALVAVVGVGFADENATVDITAKEIGVLAKKGLQSLEWGLLLETEGYYTKIGGASESGIIQATVEFKMEAAVAEWLRGNVGLLWEQESREDNNIDEAFVTLGATESIPYYLVAGRFYQPVGNFESAFISDPMTLELMEMNRTAGMVGYGNQWIDANVGAFNGDTKKGVAEDEGGDAMISDVYATVSLSPAEQVQCGAYWLSDMMETYNYGGVGQLVADQPGYDKVGGAGAFINVYLGLLTFNFEYAAALDSYNLDGGQYTPAAFNIEGSAQIHDRVVVGLKYEASDDLYAGYDRVALQFGDKYPGQAYGAVVSYGFHDNAAIAAEYLRVEELDDNANGHVVAVQLALEI
ncbi:hypothetical protein PDESU_04378 [Pontiella desulfatans]|uniref:Porin domain-containing protein n=1 Tax=Pontiella desulfatans TaxID=2750659 RepID=A0A6C2U7D3_PONDE|nr:LbtU family siderophore porin [Pontiella desulfatans]VGO15793.1 hypothetical protein PDESU_04378 [Pontiella desulfatans]